MSSLLLMVEFCFAPHHLDNCQYSCCILSQTLQLLHLPLGVNETRSAKTRQWWKTLNLAQPRRQQRQHISANKILPKSPRCSSSQPHHFPCFNYLLSDKGCAVLLSQNTFWLSWLADTNVGRMPPQRRAENKIMIQKLERLAVCREEL